MTPPLKGQIAWITGGGSGIGLAGAIELAKAGAHVVISGRNAATNVTALASLQALGSAEALLLEVADKDAVKAAAQHNGKQVMRAEWGPSVAKNPFLQFSVKGAKAGDKITITWVDNKGDKRTDEATVS